ncbi:MAG: hypothetical protein FJZ00_07230 [Candidatus Sericytochromatia bacterium]|uniref:Uncharacterized protein n=1 Tax=Candidatus Tanganyikabacteria bacterium TaxID=2961651 RepID=A0A937X304_9BACT|nr:hypothetical protein [Candidatus Tanganyikabacteria bacterium]
MKAGNSRRFAGFLGAMTFCAAGCQGDFLTGVTQFIFPESRPEVIRFPLTSSDTGGIYGHVEDASGSAIEGAKVAYGASSTFTGPIQVQDASGSRFTLPAGNFILVGLPVQTTVVTVTYDELAISKTVTLKSTNSFEIRNAAGALGKRPFGLKDEAASFSLPIVLPARNALRVVRFLPSTLTDTATGSKVTFAGGGLVAFELRNGPKAPAVEVVKVQVDYRDEADNRISLKTKPVTTAVVPGGSPNTGGPAVTIAADLSDTSLGTTNGNATAKVTFIVRTPGDASTEQPAIGEDGQTIIRTVPLSLSQ